MGMIAELHDVNISLNQKLKDKQERENKKALIENYNAEIKGNLQALFYNLFETYPTDQAYKKAIIEKEENINTLTELIENIKIPKNNKLYYLYRQFDIVQDLQNNYFILLDKIKKEYTRIEEIKNKEIIEKLEDYIIQRFENAPNKKQCYKVLQQKIYIDYAIKDVAKNKKEVETLQNNYFKTLQKIKKYYNGYIIEEQEKEKEYKEQKRELEKIKRRDKLLSKMIVGQILKDLNRKSK